MNFIVLILENLIRFFGLFWILGGLVTIQKARESRFMDDILAQLEQNKGDYFLSNYLLVCGILTVLSGLGLVWNQPPTIFLLLSLIICQLSYFYLKNKRQDEDDKIENPLDNGGFLTSVIVTLIFLLELSLKQVI